MFVINYIDKIICLVINLLPLIIINLMTLSYPNGIQVD